jgi:hypothetical protein
VREVTDGNCVVKDDMTEYDKADDVERKQVRAQSTYCSMQSPADWSSVMVDEAESLKAAKDRGVHSYGLNITTTGVAIQTTLRSTSSTLPKAYDYQNHILGQLVVQNSL